MSIFSRFLRSAKLMSAVDVWQQEGGYVARFGQLILTDRAVLRPNTPMRNIRNRWQIVRNNADQTLVKLFRSRASAEAYLFGCLELA